MSQIIKPVMLDETGQVTNVKLDELKTQVNSALAALSTNINATLTNYASTQNATLTSFSTSMNGTMTTMADDINTTLSDLSDDINTTLSDFSSQIQTILSAQLSTQNTVLTNGFETLTDGLIGVLASVKSVNGKYGVVVLDSGDILISKSEAGSKSVQTMLSEMNAAIAQTPLTFGASQIAGTDDEYLLEISQGTPA